MNANTKIIMGNICASERNKECLYAAKHPQNVIAEFDNCLIYSKRKCSTKKQLVKKKAKLIRRIDSIDQRLSDGDY